MDIKKYYQLSSETYMNGSLLSIWLAVGFSLIFIQQFDQLWWLIFLPFLLFSILLLQYAQNYERKAMNVDISPPEHTRCQNDVLLTFLPAPTLRMLIFHPDGQLSNEVHDLNMAKWRWLVPKFLLEFLPCSYVIKNDDGQVLATIKLKNRKGFKVFNHEKKLIAVFHDQSKGNYYFQYSGVLVWKDQSVMMHIKDLYNFSIKNSDGLILANYKKGWMPLEWGKRFYDFNTPIISFHERTTLEDKFVMYAICTYILNNRIH